MKLILFRNDTLNDAINTSSAGQEYINNTKRFDNMSVKLIYLEPYTIQVFHWLYKKSFACGRSLLLCPGRVDKLGNAYF